MTPRKQRQLAAMGQAYVFETDWRGPWRIDVIAVEIEPDGTLARLEHLCDAVQG